MIGPIKKSRAAGDRLRTLTGTCPGRSYEGSIDREPVDEKFFVCSIEPLVFTRQTNADDIRDAFNRWLAQSLAVTMLRSRNMGTASRHFYWKPRDRRHENRRVTLSTARHFYWMEYSERFLFSRQIVFVSEM